MNTSMTKSVQVGLSANSANSVFEATYLGDLLKYHLDSSVIPATSPFQLTTTYLDALLTGLKKKYPKNTPVTIDIQISAPPYTIFKNKQFGVVASADLYFMVKGDLVCVLSLDEFTLKAIIKL